MSVCCRDRSVGNSLAFKREVLESDLEQFNCLETLMNHSLLKTDIEAVSGCRERMECESREGTLQFLGLVLDLSWSVSRKEEAMRLSMLEAA